MAQRSSTTSTQVALEVESGVARLTLLRPEKRNAVTAEMWLSMVTHLTDVARDPNVRVLVVRGSGDSFSAGADLGSVKEADGSAAMPYRELAVAGIEAIAAIPVPTVAMIEGPCYGAGCSLALACDVRFADSAARFSIPAARHGIVYDEASIGRLVALVGPSRAARMLYAAEVVDGPRAELIGLVDQTTADLECLVSSFVRDVVRGDPTTIRTTRAIVRALAMPS